MRVLWTIGVTLLQANVEHVSLFVDEVTQSQLTAEFCRVGVVASCDGRL